MQLGKVAVVMAMIFSWWLFNPTPPGSGPGDEAGRGSLAHSDTLPGR